LLALQRLASSIQTKVGGQVNVAQARQRVRLLGNKVTGDIRGRGGCRRRVWLR
jgi:hypothetical protein